MEEYPELCLMTLTFETPICLFAEHSSTFFILWEFGEGDLKICDKSQEPCPPQYICTQLPWSIFRPKTQLKRAFFNEEQKCGLVFGWGRGGSVKKKQARRITITFPSCLCPRVQLVIEEDREGATEPTKTRLWPSEETFSWFWHWHLKGSCRLLKFGEIYLKTKQNNTGTISQAVHPFIMLLWSLRV